MIATLRANWGLVAVGLLGVALMIILPLTLDLFELLQITLYAIFAILALSLAFIWGYEGILCFGHSAFFGLGAYAYAVAVINIGDSTAPFLLAMLLPALLAAALGTARRLGMTVFAQRAGDDLARAVGGGGERLAPAVGG